MQLRDYQAHAVDSVFRYFSEGNKGNPILALPTGTGKSVVIAGFVAEAFRRYYGLKILCLTHVKELIAQNHSKMLSVWPSAPAGIFSAGLGRKDTSAPITFAGIASVVACPEAFGRVDLVIIDECHLVSPKEGTLYQEVLGKLRAINPTLKVIGLTATHYRLGQGALTEDGGIFTDVACDLTTFENYNRFIDEGYLSMLVARPMATTLDTEGVKVSHGEYNLKQLQRTVDRAEVTKAALEEACRYGIGQRNHWLVFASGVDHAEHCAEALRSLGVTADCVHSKMPEGQRDSVIAAFLRGEIQALANNGILTTGFDFPALDMIVMLRPTVSPGLWVQMLGRGGRPCYAPGFDLSTTEGRLAAIAAGPKRDCLVLDFAGNTRRLGPINDPVRPKKKGQSTGEAPVKTCPSCGCYCHSSARVCAACGNAFPLIARFKATAYADDIVKRTAELPKQEEPHIEPFDVDRVVYSSHMGAKGRSLRVSYHCGLRVFREHVCIEYTGYPLRRAREWWSLHHEALLRLDGVGPTAARAAIPETVDEALESLNCIAKPKRIHVWINTKYPEVKRHEFT